MNMDIPKDHELMTENKKFRNWLGNTQPQALQQEKILTEHRNMLREKRRLQAEKMDDEEDCDESALPIQGKRPNTEKCQALAAVGWWPTPNKENRTKTCSLEATSHQLGRTKVLRPNQEQAFPSMNLKMRSSTEVWNY